MNKIILTSFLLMLSLSGRSHDIRMAQFTIHVEKEQLICDGRIDKEDFQTALGEDFSKSDMENYFKDHLTIKFNSSDVSFSLVSFELSKNWISIRFSLETNNHSPSEVEVINTVLWEDLDGHDNIMRFVLHHKSRTFRLNEKRKMISFYY